MRHSHFIEKSNGDLVRVDGPPLSISALAQIAARPVGRGASPPIENVEEPLLPPSSAPVAETIGSNGHGDLDGLPRSIQAPLPLGAPVTSSGTEEPLIMPPMAFNAPGADPVSKDEGQEAAQDDEDAPLLMARMKF